MKKPIWKLCFPTSRIDYVSSVLFSWWNRLLNCDLQLLHFISVSSIHFISLHSLKYPCFNLGHMCCAIKIVFVKEENKPHAIDLSHQLNTIKDLIIQKSIVSGL